MIVGVHLTGVVVDDIEKVAADFADVFEVEITIHDHKELGLRFAPIFAGATSLCLLAPIEDGSSEMIDKWHQGMLGGIEILVDDLEKTREKLEEKGVLPIYSGRTPGGFNEYVMQRFHGVPLVICTREVEDVQQTMGGGEGVAKDANTPFTWYRTFDD